MFGVEVPYSERAIIGGCQKIIIFRIDNQIGDRIAMSFECFDDLIFMDGPIQHHMIFFGGNNDSIIVVSMRQLLNLIIFHEQLSIALCIAG